MLQFQIESFNTGPDSKRLNGSVALVRTSLNLQLGVSTWNKIRRAYVVSFKTNYFKRVAFLN